MDLERGVDRFSAIAHDPQPAAIRKRILRGKPAARVLHLDDHLAVPPLKADGNRIGAGVFYGVVHGFLDDAKQLYGDVMVLNRYRSGRLETTLDAALLLRRLHQASERLL